jgi:hypothetical protein
MSGDEDYPLDDEAKAYNAEVQTRLSKFDRRKVEILGHLQDVCRRSFDPDKAWRLLGMHAWSYLQELVRLEMAPNIDWAKEFHQIERHLGAAHDALNKVRGPVFVEWCEAHGNPDFLDPIMSIYERRFNALLTGLTDIATAASRAAGQMRRRAGRPGGAGERQIELIIGLEHTYRDITGTPGGAGRGPFARFIKEFLGALGHMTTEENAAQLIRAARKNPRWGRSFFG